MPKMKTHKGTAKRVHVTGTGKLRLRYMNPKKAKRSREKRLLKIKGLRPADASVTKALGKNLPYTRAAR